VISSQEELLLPVLQVFADGKEHSLPEIRSLMVARFHVTEVELAQKQKHGKSAFDNYLDLAVANLQGAPHRGVQAIRKVESDQKVYKVTDAGLAILKTSRSALTLKDLARNL